MKYKWFSFFMYAFDEAVGVHVRLILPLAPKYNNLVVQVAVKSVIAVHMRGLALVASERIEATAVWKQIAQYCLPDVDRSSEIEVTR